MKGHTAGKWDWQGPYSDDPTMDVVVHDSNVKIAQKIATRDNAALIAAAPLLLEALKEARACWRPRPTMDGKDFGHFDQATLKELLPRIDSAIAAATRSEK